MFALGSVVLVSVAQLGMRWGMAQLPSPGSWPAAFLQQAVPLAALLVICGAVLAYALSMACWLGALRDLPLGRAYSLLSISYVLVYLLAGCLPAFNETFTPLKSLGVTLVVIGVLVINSQRRVHS